MLNLVRLQELLNDKWINAPQPRKVLNMQNADWLITNLPRWNQCHTDLHEIITGLRKYRYGQ